MIKPADSIGLKESLVRTTRRKSNGGQSGQSIERKKTGAKMKKKMLGPKKRERETIGVKFARNDSTTNCQKVNERKRKAVKLIMVTVILNEIGWPKGMKQKVRLSDKKKVRLK